MELKRVTLKDGSFSEVRPSTAEDAAALEQLYALTLTTADWLPTVAKVDLDFQASAEGEEVFVCVAEKTGELQGLISVYASQSFVHHLYVDQLFQRLGVGAALLASLQSWLPQPWRLKCTESNRSALGFYQSLGWEKVSSGDGDQGNYFLLQYAEY